MSCLTPPPNFAKKEEKIGKIQEKEKNQEKLEKLRKVKKNAEICTLNSLL